MSLPTAIKASPPRAGWREVALFFALVALVFITRIPFLDAGYALQSDGWRVIEAAQHFAVTGNYHPSRLPGNPIYEMSLALVSFDGPVVTNGLTALMSAFAVGFLALSLQRLGSKDAVLTSLALCAIPVFYIFSVSTLDYVWSFALMVMSFYATLIHKSFLAGLLLGVATGSRITYGAMILPFGILFAYTNKHWMRDLALFLLPAGLVSILTFTPNFEHYGLSFLRVTAYGSPSLRAVLNNGLLGVWGILGAIGIILAVGATLVTRRIFPLTSSIPASLPT